MTSPLALLAAFLPLLTPDITPDAPALCAGGSVVLDAGPGFTAYLWSTGETTRSIIVSPQQTSAYSVVVTQLLGPKDQAVETVNVHEPPAVALHSDVSQACQDQQVPLEFWLEGSPGFLTYQWACDTGTLQENGNQAALTLPPGFTGTVSCAIVVTDANGCTAAATSSVAVLAPPVVSAGSDRTVCRGDSITLPGQATGAIGFRWSPPDGLDDPTIPQPTLQVDATRIYSLVATDYNGCQGFSSVRITAVDPGVRDELGNTLRLVKRGADLQHAWTDQADMVQYRLDSSTARDFATAQAVGSAAAGTQILVEDNRMSTFGSRYYRLTGSVCP